MPTVRETVDVDVYVHCEMFSDDELISELEERDYRVFKHLEDYSDEELLDEVADRGKWLILDGDSQGYNDYFDMKEWFHQMFNRCKGDSVTKDEIVENINNFVKNHPDCIR